jgi:Ca-activated chloride channel family protein
MIGRSILAGLVAAALLPFGGSAYRKTEQGNRQYIEGLYQDALRSYTEAQVEAPESAELYYDIGNVLYRDQDFEGAAEAFTRALLAAGDDLVGSAAFNLGNARYQQEEFQEAVEAYERALKADPADRDAKRNLELSLRALEQQQQDQQQQQEQQDEEDRDSESEPQQQEQEGQQEQQQEEQEEQEQPSEGQEDDSGGSAAQPDPSDGEQDPAEQEQPQPLPGEMSAEQAERLLDGLSEQELENLRQRALQKPSPSQRTTEEDW